MTKMIKSTNPFVKYRHLSKMFLIMTDICKKSKVKIYLGFSNRATYILYICLIKTKLRYHIQKKKSAYMHIILTFYLSISISQLAKADRVNISQMYMGSDYLRL